MTGGAIQKSGYANLLNLQPGEVDLVKKSHPSILEALPKAKGQARQKPKSQLNPKLLNILRAFEGSPLPSQLPSPNVFVNIPTADLLAFGKGLVQVRQLSLNKLKKQGASTAQGSLQPGLGMKLLNDAIVNNKAFEASPTVSQYSSPIGMLNLETLEMTPAGIERGQLLATIPLAPREKTGVVQKEWSVTSQEFTSIVTDSLENYSETGVTDNTDLKEATTAQAQHNNQFNINASVSGGCGFVSGSVATGYAVQDQVSQSESDSRDNAISLTRQASSRVRQEHKTSISTTTVTGSGDATTRILENPSATNPMRIDYFSMMCKWRVRLYRYGLRLTYDITIPEPGAAMREVYAQITILQAQASQTFADYFTVNYSDITPQNYKDIILSLASKYGAQVSPPPGYGGTPPVVVNTDVTSAAHLDESESWHFYPLTINVPDGVWITDVTINAQVGIGHGFSNNAFGVDGTGTLASPTGYYVDNPSGPHYYYQDLTIPQYGNFMLHASGTQTILFFFQWADTASVGVKVLLEPTPAAIAQWASSVYTALFNAAQTIFYAEQQSINAQIAALQNEINNADTLTLRREESDEVMKGVLRWLLGPGFYFMPPEVVSLFTGSSPIISPVYGVPPINNPSAYGVSFTGNDLGLSKSTWSTMFQYQQMVKFINEAIDWEDLVYFVYSYFWDEPQAWDFIRNIRHPDSTRQAFLRAGSARIVLTVQPGYEQAWTSFVELGDLEGAVGLLPTNHPYMTIAQEIQNYANTYYPGIPPANPDGDPPDGTITTYSPDKVAASPKHPVTLTVDFSTGFIIGSTVWIDTNDSNVQESQVVTAIPDATHITLKRLQHAHDGSSTEFPIVQATEAGVLIGEWYEYTPSSGTDIAVDSNLATVNPPCAE